NVRELAARIREVLADVVVDLDTELCQLGIHHLLEQGATTTATCRGTRRRLDVAEARHALTHQGTDTALADVVAGTDLGGFRQSIDAERRCAPGNIRQDQR